jgi:hypothetical protein
MNARSALVLVVSQLLLLGMAGCATSSRGGQTGEESSHCETIRSTALAATEKSPLGFGGDEVLALTDGARTATLAWAKGGTTTLAVTFTPRGTPAEYLERGYVDTGDGREVAEVGCANGVAIEGVVSFVTTDGAFDETLDAVLVAYDVNDVMWTTELDLAALGGDYTVTEVDPSDHDGVRAFLNVQWNGSGAHGTVEGQAADSPQGNAPNGTVGARSFGIASF